MMAAYTTILLSWHASQRTCGCLAGRCAKKHDQVQNKQDGKPSKSQREPIGIARLAQNDSRVADCRHGENPCVRPRALKEFPQNE